MSRSDAIQIFLSGVDAVKPAKFIPQHILLAGTILQAGQKKFVLSNKQKVYIAAAGKAASAMALETEKILGEYIHDGIVITKYRHALPLQKCRTIEAGHPVPDDNSVAGAAAITALFKKATDDDIILLLVSGGASALLCDLPPGCSLNDIQSTGQLLLDCGAAIEEVNTVRKHLSLIKGGQLMAYTNATVIALILSDVPGDDLSVIASGLTVADRTSFKDAREIVEKYALTEKIPLPVKEWLHHGVSYIQPSHKNVFEKVTNVLVATNTIALNAAAEKARTLGYDTHIITPPLQGDAATQAANFIKQLTLADTAKRCCYLWGGETTVTIQGNGKGGRNQQFALAAACALKDNQYLQKRAPIIVAGGTDGTDGPTDATGAVADFAILKAAADFSLAPEEYLTDNDAYTFFEKTNGLLITGPTQTNVMDIVAGLINTR